MWFFTATINSWKPLLKEDEIKNIVVDSMQWHCDQQRALIHGFVIMPNHIHIVWTSTLKAEHWQNGTSLLKNTGHEFKKYLKQNNPNQLLQFQSTQADRAYHFWERRPRSIEILNRDIAWQKLSYMHRNPIQDKWKLCQYPEDYKYSSAGFYHKEDKSFSFLTHFMDYI